MVHFQFKYIIIVVTILSLNKNVFGCFHTDDKCPNENITFWLYTKESSSTPIILDLNNLSSDIFKEKRNLVILIHGYTGHKDYSPNTQIRPVLLNERNTYVISPDFNPLVQEPCYIEAVSNLKPVSRCIGQLINSLLDQKIFNLEDIHVIGFSLGAHVAGMTANFVTRKLKRITGLDPAKPLFTFAHNENKLDPSDAEFVDIIHTDILGRGLFGPNGHVDFYPNSGFNQPGCVEESPDSIGSCNHNRAPAYYAESIKPINEFSAYQCPNWFQCMIGQFPWADYSEEMIMGYDVPLNASGIYFLQTNSKPPFSRGNYRGQSNGKMAFLE